jgi:subtilisin family serine protease
LGDAYGNPNWQERGEYVYQTLFNVAQTSQEDMLAYLNEQSQFDEGITYRSFYIVNAVAVTGDVNILDTLAARSDVAYIESIKEYSIPEPIPGEDNGINALEWGVSKIRADEIWADFGVQGEDVVVANIDTGVLDSHAALVNQYRGTVTGSHDYNWYDPSGTFPTQPGDNNGHGTHTMGTMVGDDGGSNQIGVAPGAQWIAAKGCASSSCSGSHLLAAAEWVLAPYPIGGTPADGDPSKRPHLVNNSWGSSTSSTWYQASVQAWRASDILPVFSAGNSGPGAGTVGSPGDYAESFAVGATDSSDLIAWFSSRGPSSQTGETKPDVSAPGVSVRSAWNNGSYVSLQGTSMAAPHVAGCAALLKSLDPSLTIDQIENVLMSTAVDLGSPGADDDYGHGRIDCRAAADGPGDPPDIEVNPESFEVTLAEGESTTEMLDIGNVGAGTLNWQIATSQGVTARDPYPAGYFTELAKDAVDNRTGHPVVQGQGGSDDFGHGWIDSNEPGGPVFDWVDITSDGTPVTLSDDSFAEVTLPFTFSFYGVEQTSIKISSNGYLTFGGDGTDLSNDPIPSSNDPNDLIAPFWDDLNPASGGTVHYYDDAANNRFIVQYTDMPRFSGPGDYTFQVMLYADGTMLFQYLDMNGATTSATIGIENADASDGLEVAFNTNYVENDLAVLVSFTGRWLTTSPTSGTVAPSGSESVSVGIDATDLTAGSYNGTLTISSNDPDENPVTVPVELTVTSPNPPDIDVNPESFEVTLAEGESTTEMLTIDNVGTGSLSFDIAVSSSSTPLLLDEPRTFNYVPVAGDETTGTENSLEASSSSQAYRFEASATSSSASVLYFTDISAAAERVGEQALANLDVSVTGYVGDYSGFLADLSSGTWDVVLYESAANLRDITPLVDYVANGGKLISSYWKYDATFAAGMEANYVGSFSTPLDVYPWQSHPIFTSPNAVPDLVAGPDDHWNDNGDRFEPVGSAVALGGYTSSPTANEAAIILGNEERTILNGMIFEDFLPIDSDSDAKPDIIELVENEVMYLLDGGASGWLSATPTSGTVAPGGSADIDVGIDATDLTAGTYAGLLTITSNDPDEPTVEVPVDLTVTSDSEFSISLESGWNLVSIPLQPADSDIEQVLDSIAGSYDLVIAYDACDPVDQWKQYDPSAPPFANDLNNIGESIGFWVKMTAADTLVVSGSEPGSTTMPLCTGWNLTGYPSLDVGELPDALDESIAGAYDLVNAYKAAQAPPWKTFDPNAPPFANTLTNMQPSFGYWIKANQDIDLIINN